MEESRRPRTHRELVRSRGYRRAHRGMVSMHRGIWLPDHAIIDEQTELESLTAINPEVVATGWLAAKIWGHPWVGTDTRLEVVVPSKRIRRPGVLCREYEIPERYIEEMIGPGGGRIRIAKPVWSMFDVARFSSLDDAVIALDGAWRMWPNCDPKHEFPPLLRREPKRRYASRAIAAMRLCNIDAESPWETRTRLFLLSRGFDCFEVQYKVTSLRYRLDLAAAEYKVAVEYDGAGHRDGGQHANDLYRGNRLRAAGWHVISVTKRMLLHQPDEIARQVDDALRSRGWTGPESDSC